MNSLFILPSKHVFGGWTFWSLWKAFLVLSLLISLILVVQLLIKFGPLQGKFRRELLQNSPPYFVSCLMLIKATGVIKLFCDYSNLTWHQLNNIPSCPLTSITKGPHWAIARNFPDSIQADMNFRHCLSPFCFDEQVVTSCKGILINGPWFTCAHAEVGGGTSFALLNEGKKFGVLLLQLAALASSNVVATLLQFLLH